METSFQKFFIEAKSIDEKKSVFSSALILIFCTSVVFSAVIYFLSGAIAGTITSDNENAYLIRLLAVILVIDALYRFPMILINSEQRSKLYSALNAIAVIINVAMNVIFIILLNYGIEAIFYSYLISYAFLFVVSFIYSFKYFSFTIKADKIKRLLKTAHLFLYYGLFLISMDLIDRFILEYFKGTSDVGIYSACYRIGIVMNLVITGFKVAWTPFFLNLKDEESNKEIFTKIFTYFCYGGLIVFLTFSLFADDLVKINVAGYTLLNQNYWGGLFIVPYILMAYLFSGLYLNLTVASFFQNKIKYLIISSGIGCAGNIIFNLILIPLLGMLGAAISTMVSYMLMFFVLYFFSQRIYKIPYQWNLIFKALVLTCIVYAINIYISGFVNINYIAKFIAEILSVIFVYLLLLGKKTLEILKTYGKKQA
jgi:O-antigen/teichoic acid export membrane protein